MTSCFSSIADMGDRAADIAARHIITAVGHLVDGPSVVRTDAYLQVITGEAHPLGNFACLHDASDAASADKAGAILAACGAPSAVLTAGPVSAEVDAALVAHGFAALPPMPAMAVNINELKPTAPAEGYTYRRVTTAADLDRWVHGLAMAYPLPLGVAKLFSIAPERLSAADDAMIQFFFVEKDGEVVATSAVVMTEGVAGIYAVSTHPDHRGKGLGAHVAAEPLRVATKFGYRVGVLQASPDGHPVYLRIGYGDYGSVPLFMRMPE